MKTVRFLLSALLLAFTATLAYAQNKESDRNRAVIGIPSQPDAVRPKFPRISAIERENRQRRADAQASAERNPRMVPIDKPLPKK